MRLTHLSLFSGIGGLDLAAEWAGIETVGQCEWADYPTKVLERHWPNVPRWKDIRTLTKESFYERTGRRTVDIISGGFPCQPFSVAGKQRGKEDDRYLWPEMVRVIKELRPTWVVGENVAGIVKMALADILSELEACGYRTRVFLVPACAVGARHRRYRVAIVAHSGHNVLQRREHKAESSKGASRYEPESCSSGGAANVANTDTKRELQQAGSEQNFRDGAGICGKNVQYPDCTEREEQYAPGESDRQGLSCGGCDAGDVCDVTGQGFPDGTGQPLGKQGTQEPEPERPDCDVSNSNNGSGNVRRNGELPASEEIGSARNYFRTGAQKHEPGEWRPIKPLLGGMANGIPTGMDRDFLIGHYWDVEPDIPRIATGVAHRVDRLKCLGNAVVPQQFYPIFQAIAEIKGMERDAEDRNNL